MAEKFKVGKDLVKHIDQVRDRLEETKGEVQSLHDEMEELVDAMREAWNERSEKWQEGERAEAATSWIDELENRMNALDELMDTMGNVVDDSLTDVPTEPEY